MGNYSRETCRLLFTILEIDKFDPLTTTEFKRPKLKRHSNYCFQQKDHTSISQFQIQSGQNDQQRKIAPNVED